MKTNKKATKQWRQIQKNSIQDFKKIVEVLNRFYEVSEVKESESYKFRKSLEKEDTEKFQIFLKKFGKYEFLVYAEISDTEKGSRSDSWIHIDGIAEEREQLRKKGNEDHPVFSIRCLTDIFEISEKVNLDLSEVNKNF